ncbi:MAG: hypothetical protein MUE54_01910 [Anaerolineae bacterium]|nr:hypothetical protein [Anaerolineae bacterium]
MSNTPAKLQALLTDFSAITDRHERAEYLIEIADRFADVRVPAEISTRPHSEPKFRPVRIPKQIMCRCANRMRMYGQLTNQTARKNIILMC